MKNLTLIIFVTVLAGCDNNKVYDIEYYKANPEQAQQTLDKCSSGSSSGENCSNAKAGLSKFNEQKFMDQMNGK